jgi:hypothetical protein
MATKLSNELLNAIFADLSKADLLSIIKTHRVFYKSAQRYLFHTIKIPTQSTIVSTTYERPSQTFPVGPTSGLELENELDGELDDELDDGGGVELPMEQDLDNHLDNDPKNKLDDDWDTELELELERDARGKSNLSLESSPILLPVPDSHIPREMAVSEAYGKVTTRQSTAALLLQAIVAEPKLAHLVRHVHLDCEWGEPLFINTQVSDILSRTNRSKS